MIITRGYGTGLIITRGYGGWSAFIEELKEIFQVNSFITKIVNLISRLSCQ